MCQERPSRAHITPQHVLACSEQGCISLPWSPRAAVSGSPGKPSPPTQELPFPALPVPQPSPAVMEKGCHCPQVPQEGGCALALREGDEGLFLAQTQHPHPSLAQHRAGSGPGCCPCCFQHLKSVLLMQNEHKGRAKAPGSALQLSSLKHSHGSENPLAWFYFLPTIQSFQSKLELEKTQISSGF